MISWTRATYAEKFEAETESMNGQCLPTETRLTDSDVEHIRAIGDNTGCMALKGASPGYTGDPRPDRWELDSELEELASRWGIDPERDLVEQPQAAPA